MESNNRTFYVCVLALSVLFLIVGNRLTGGRISMIDAAQAPAYYAAVVVQITDRAEGDFDLWFATTDVSFNARITDRARRGEIVAVQQHLSEEFSAGEREVTVGDRIIIVHDAFGGRFFFVDFVRIHHIIALGALFLVLVIALGRKKGFNGVVSLGLSCAAVFWVFIPAILAGRNIYVAAIIVCVYAIVSTLLLVIGPNRKAVSAMLGCLGGVLMAGILMAAMDTILGLTGAINREALSLLDLPTPVPLDLRAIIFAGVIFGAVGAIMDVAMSIASALWEVRSAGGVSDFGSLVKSGITIGQDTLGTMLNTLVMAYVGSSLSIILLMAATTTSLAELFNMEMIIVELLRALVGSFGMLLTIPLTAGICGWLFSAEN